MFTPPLLNCCLIVLRVRVGVLSAQKGDKSGPSIRSAAAALLHYRGGLGGLGAATPLLGGSHEETLPTTCRPQSRVVGIG